MKIKNILLFLIFTNIYIVKAIDMEININKNEIDSVIFNYYPFNHDDLVPLYFKLYKDTLFVFQGLYYEDTLNNNKRNVAKILIEKIVNKDTLNLIKDFIKLFILEKTEYIIIENHDQEWEMDYTVLDIKGYKRKKLYIFKV